MKLASSAQMRDLDSYAIEVLGIPGAALMSNAARHIASAALERLTTGGRAAVFCGTGNNGGDGIGAAALLLEKGVQTRVFIVGNTGKLTPDSREMLERFESLGGAPEPFSDSVDIREYTDGCEVTIDAMFGTGLNSALRGDASIAADMMNSARACVISADIASGVQADTGAIPGAAVKADITLTFSLAKPGHFIEPGVINCGQLRVCDIGVPKDAVDGLTSNIFSVSGEDVALPPRRPDSHKGDFGRCLIIAGSVGYTGAPALSARAATRMGAGLVHLGVPEQIYDILAVKLDEEMPFPLPGDEQGRLAANAAAEILHRADNCDVCLIGPGIGRSPDVTELVLSTIRLTKAPVVIDADGLFAVASNIDILKQATCPLILTPHPGEFARLGGDLMSGDRLSSAVAFARGFNCVLVLKGHRTITALPDGSAYINTTGGPAMAKGGSGDVLAGMIASLIGQKFDVRDAVLTSVYSHGLAGDMCAAELGEYSVTAGDIIDMLPKALLSISGRSCGNSHNLV